MIKSVPIGAYDHALKARTPCHTLLGTVPQGWQTSELYEFDTNSAYLKTIQFMESFRNTSILKSTVSY